VNGLSEVEARYSNHLEIGQNSFEFVLEFGQLYGESEKALIHTRIVTSPFYAKQFSEILRECLRRHEEAVGPIPDHEI